ncbi:SagB/ThcOx family dehydrogenase [Nocardia sp. CC201C]|uniref:SagB/ThcOx family dehydrogenase n=1 Tax=Nocardia sp. CC201C TaxID=3044575 RepID=UPI0024A7ED9E|nr:SagB/ThcOx family dehydrogenase [Nocardia sp. CC201C]
MWRLPDPDPGAPGSLPDILARRRTVREFAPESVERAALASLLWSGQGVSGQGRTVPSAGALYPVALSVAVHRVDGLDPGVYEYRPQSHALVRTGDREVRAVLAEAAFGPQPWLRDAALVVAVTVDIDRVRAHFAEQPPTGRRGERYADMEVGHAVQNMYLQATALDLGAVFVGGFDETRLMATHPELAPANHRLRGLLAVGRAAVRRE